MLNPLFIGLCTEMPNCQTPASIPTPTSSHTKPEYTSKATSEKTSDANAGAPSQQKSFVGEKVKVEERVVDEFLNNLVSFSLLFELRAAQDAPRRTCIQVRQ